MVFGMAGMYNIDDLLNLASREGAEELRLEPGRPPVMALHGKYRVIDGTPLTADDVAALFHSIATEDQRRELDRCGNTRFTFAVRHSGQFSVSAALQGEQLNLNIKNLGL
jgi:Tfp pilus assembly ATPase PilU